MNSYQLEFDIQIPNACTLAPTVMDVSIDKSIVKVHLYRKLSGLPFYFTDKKVYKGIIADKTFCHHSGINLEQLKGVW